MDNTAKVSIENDMTTQFLKIVLDQDLNNPLTEVLTEIEFWEGGNVRIELTEIWVTGDNGTFEFNQFMKDLES